MTFRTKVIADLAAADLYKDIGLPMWTVYEKPTDFPDEIVCRLFDGMTAKMTPYVFVAKTREELIKAVPQHFIWIERDPNDDPNILGVFV
jgi:hypothetical protein